MKSLLAICALSFAVSLAAQEQQPPPATPPTTAAPPTAPAGVSAEQVAKANNPLADLNALNFHNYYVPSLYGVPNAQADNMYLRPVMVAGRQIIRATLPIATVPVGQGQYALRVWAISVSSTRSS